MKNETKNKLKRRGAELYKRYFFNPNEILEQVMTQYDNNQPIDDNQCEVIFDLPLHYDKQIYELIMYYPNKLKEIKIITENKLVELYSIYGETIEIMKSVSSIDNVRGRMANSAKRRAKEFNIECNISSEDIILVTECPLLNKPLEYGKSISSKYSPSLDRIIPSLGYTKDNIQVISMLANNMKSNANVDELITFSKNVLFHYKDLKIEA